MKNLADKVDADEDIRSELVRCGISIEEVPLRAKIVPHTLIGCLGEFMFYRAWHWWDVVGPMPIAVAEELYTDPVGQADIRAWRAGARSGEIFSPQEVARWQIYHEGLDRWLEVDSKDSSRVKAQQYVLRYEIHTEIGLRLFADKLRKHDLAFEPKPDPKLAEPIPA